MKGIKAIYKRTPLIILLAVLLVSTIDAVEAKELAGVFYRDQTKRPPLFIESQ